MTHEDFLLLPTPQKIATMLAPHVNCFHEQTRKGPTAVGHTLESICFDKAEDNWKERDFYDAELKGCTSRSKSARVRLGTVTFINSLTGGPVGNDLLTTFGRTRYSKSNDTYEQAFTKSVNSKRAQKWAIVGGASHEAKFSLTGERIVLDAGPVQAHIERSTINAYLAEKAPNLCVVKADVKKLEKSKEFRYHAFDYFEGLSIARFWQAVEDGLVTFEFRIQGRDRGCSINISLNKFSHIYDTTYHWNGATNELVQVMTNS